MFDSKFDLRHEIFFFGFSHVIVADFTDSDISLMRDRSRDAYGNRLPENLTVSRTIQLRTNDVMKARAAYAKQADLLRAGVEIGGGSVNYTFPGLNELKPEIFIVGEDGEPMRNDAGNPVTYPMSVGRNFDEILRVIDALQLGDAKRIATPADWRPGDKVIIPPSISNEDAKDIFPQGWDEVRSYLRLTEV